MSCVRPLTVFLARAKDYPHRRVPWSKAMSDLSVVIDGSIHRGRSQPACMATTLSPATSFTVDSLNWHA